MTELKSGEGDGAWLSSAEALRRVEDVMGQHAARHAIADRAHDGLIRTRAHRFVKHKEVADEVELPKEFWWAGAHQAMEQNWVAGDFSTWINRMWHWKAYGVRFLEADIAKLIPDPPAASSKPSEYIASGEALDRVCIALEDETSAAGTILEWLKCGELPAKARTFRMAAEEGPILTEQEKVLSAQDWERFDELPASAFKAGIAVTTGWDGWARNTVTTRMTGLRFSEAVFEALLASLPPRTAVATAAPLSRSRGGRPNADWWDDLWVEICRQLYTGDLQPKKQADIETAMHDWLSDRGESAATSTLRARARKLWMAIEAEDEN